MSSKERKENQVPVPNIYELGKNKKYENSNASEYETEASITSHKKRKTKELENSEISILYEKPSSNLKEECFSKKRCKVNDKECHNKGESQFVQSEFDCTTIPDTYEPEKRKKILDTLKISECESSKFFEIVNKNYKDIENSDIAIVYEKPQKPGAENLVSKNHYKRKESWEKGESSSLQPDFDCSIYKTKKKKKHSKEIENLQNKSLTALENIDETKRKKKTKELENSGISLLHEKLEQPSGHLDSECFSEKQHEIQSTESHEFASLNVLTENDGSVVPDDTISKRKKKKKKSKVTENYVSNCEFLIDLGNSHENKKKKRTKELNEINNAASYDDTPSLLPEVDCLAVPEKTYYQKKIKDLKSSESIEYESLTALKDSHKKKKKKKCKGLENSEVFIEHDTSKEPSMNSVVKYFSKDQTNIKNKESYEENVTLNPELDCSTIYQQKKRKKTLEGSKDSNVPECELPALENSHKEKKKKKCEVENSEVSIENDMSLEPSMNSKDSDVPKCELPASENSHKKKKKKKCKEVENSEVSIENDTSQEPSMNSVVKCFSKDQTNLKNKESYEENVILNPELDCSTIYQQKKRKKTLEGSKDSNFPECELQALENSHKKKKKKKCKEKNKESYEENMIPNPELDCSTIYQQKKRKKTFKGSKDSNVPECESAALENSHKKKKKKKCKEVNSEICIEYESSQEPTKNLEVGEFFSKKHKLKCNESYEKHVNLQLETDGTVIPHNICEPKKRKRNYRGLNVLEYESTALENNHENKTVSVSVLEANSCKLDRLVENDFRTRENDSSIILDNLKDTEELENSEVPIDYERIKKTKKRKRNFDGPKDSNVLECESSSLEESHIKEMKNTASVSVREDNSSDSDELIDDDFGTKERDSSIVLEAIEEPVNFQIPPLHKAESLKGLTKEEQNILKSQGVEIKQGKWSSSEDAILKENYEEFCSTFKVNDPYLLLGIGRNKKPEAAVLNFFKAKHFYVRLGRNLNNRSLYSIYTRARLLFNPFRNIKIKESPEEKIVNVMNYQKVLGNKWQQIGCRIEKTNSKVRKCFEWNNKPIKKGDWAPEEEELLTYAIHSLVKIPNISGRHSKLIPWSKVADLVPTRNTSQCRLHWGECMAWEPDAKRMPWTKAKDEELVKELISRGNIYECEIDWGDVHKVFKDFAPSHMFLRKKFRKLKTKKKFQYILEKSGLPLEGFKS